MKRSSCTSIYRHPACRLSQLPACPFAFVRETPVAYATRRPRHPPMSWKNTAEDRDLDQHLTATSFRIGFDDIGLIRFMALAISYAALVRFAMVTPELGSSQSERTLPPRRTVLVKIEIILYPVVCLTIFVWYCIDMPFDEYLIDRLGLALVFLVPAAASLEGCRRLWKERI